MPLSQVVTETIILHPKEGVNLENVASGTRASGNPAVQAFIQLTDTVKFRQGFIRQFWVIGLHLALSMHKLKKDWASFEYNSAFVNSEEHNSFVASMGHVFDVEVAAPLTSLTFLVVLLTCGAESDSVYTRFTSDATAALAAPVTEVAFYTVPNDAREDAKTLIEDDVIDNTHPVITVGKSSGGAIGWVFDTKNAGDAAPDGESIALHGVFGYASVDDHLKWRETPEHTQLIEDLGRSPLENLGLGNASMPGGNIFVPDSSMFHVKFRAGT
ncbi:MAG: hypothetical protein ASARMPRED_007812 [Alectoria sarmentosa]|nr:MAG: hypothetical protein ASARMPRED_007812 [Alectoria sarmentosa]